MSMYTELLSAAIEGLGSSTDKSTSGEVFAELLRCRNRLGPGISYARSHSSSDIVADELAYDITLIEFARRLGVECGINDFESPGHGRTGLERNLGSRGIRIETPDEESHPR
jgi:hypothetical protein